MKRRRFFLLVFIFLYIVPVNLAPSSAPLAIPTDKNILSEETSYYVENGRVSYLGSGVYSYSTSLGERNTWNGDSWEPYVVSGNSVQFAGMTLNIFDWFAVLEQDDSVVVDDLRWEVETLNKQDKWITLDLWERSVIPAIESGSNVVIGQSMTDGFSYANVTYHLSNYGGVKVQVDFIPYEAGEYRFIWSLTGIQGDILEDNSTLNFSDVNIGLNDLQTNNISYVYDWTVAEKKLDVIIGPNILSAGEHLIIDPSISDVVADEDDDWWRWNVDNWDYHATTGIEMNAWNESITGFMYVPQMRFEIAIDAGSTIDSAILHFYEEDDRYAYNMVIKRIDELNVGALESDGTKPTPSETTRVVYTWDTVEPEWSHPDIEVKTLVQEQIDLGSWVNGYYMAFECTWELNWSSGIFDITDAQAVDGNAAYLNITYTAAGAPTTTTTTTTTTITTDTGFFYQIFLSLEMWSIFGPALIVICGFVVAKKDRGLGIIFFIVECLVVYQYFMLVDATPFYWWHIIILMFGGIIPCGFSLSDR